MAATSSFYDLSKEVWKKRCGAKRISRGLVHVGFLVFLFSASQLSCGFGSYCALRDLSPPASGLLRESPSS